MKYIILTEFAFVLKALRPVIYVILLFNTTLHYLYIYNNTLQAKLFDISLYNIWFNEK